ncbi:MAG: HD domain-containing phosphohydrolase [Candidatus Hydrogenedentota bacterium]
MTQDNGATATILVVDDLEENVHFLTKVLQPKGYRVYPAYDGEEALAAVAKYAPDIILLDLMLPKLGGLEVCRRLKADSGTYHIPIVVITGVSERDTNLEAIDVGADEYLVKPVDAPMLHARIRSCLRAKSLQDQVIEYQHKLEEANHNLEERIRERTRQLERTQHVTVFSLARLAESRDTETGEHLSRIRRYVQVLAQQLAESSEYAEVIDEAFLRELFHSSPLHDIGKVGIPDQILLKPGKLTHEEFEIMKLHAVIGGDTLKAADIEAGKDSFLSMGRDIAYYHHEKWNGKGYPSGLKGTEIPLAARIVALCDTYDALTSRRPYKEAFTHEFAKEIIVPERGEQFDPAIVDAFLAVEHRFHAIQQALRDMGQPSHIEKLVQNLASMRECVAE